MAKARFFAHSPFTRSFHGSFLSNALNSVRQKSIRNKNANGSLAVAIAIVTPFLDGRDFVAARMNAP
jgi:hypothetical protein